MLYVCMNSLFVIELFCFPCIRSFHLSIHVLTTLGRISFKAIMFIKVIKVKSVLFISLQGMPRVTTIFTQTKKFTGRTIIKLSVRFSPIVYGTVREYVYIPERSKLLWRTSVIWATFSKLICVWLVLFLYKTWLVLKTRSIFSLLRRKTKATTVHWRGVCWPQTGWQRLADSKMCRSKNSVINTRSPRLKAK